MLTRKSLIASAGVHRDGSVARKKPPMRQAHIGRSVTSVMLFVALGTSVSGQSGQRLKRFLTAPLTIEDQGSFFIGGVPKVTDYATVVSPPAPGTAAATTPAPLQPHQITIGQMYVQFEIPVRKNGGGRGLMVHGASRPAPCLASTPHGREGRHPYLVRNGGPSYIVDQAGRGRFGLCQARSPAGG